MKKNEYLIKLQNENKRHINNIAHLIKALDFKLNELKKSKVKTDRICERFDIVCYNYNLVYEIEETKDKFIKDMQALTKKIQGIVKHKSRNIDYDIQKVSSINDLLDVYEVQLNAINKNDLNYIENLQLNAVKKEIYEKYMRYRAEIDRSLFKEKFDKMQSRNVILKALDEFFVLTEYRSRQKENLFVAIQGIDECVAKYVEGSKPDREYKIIDLVVDMDIYLNENKKAKRYKEPYNNILQLREKINCTFSIEKGELRKAVSERYKSKLPIPVEKSVNKVKNKYRKAIEFLCKSGYICSYETVEYKSKMAILMNKLKKLSDNVEKEVNK